MPRLCPTLAVVVAPLLLIGCGSDYQDAVQHLNQREQARLAPQLANGEASLQPLPDGTRVILPEQTLFPGGAFVLDDRSRFVLSSVVEGFLEPTLLSVDVSDAAPTPLSIREQRVRAVTQFIAGSQTAPALLPPTQPPAVATPAMAITIRVIPPKAD